MTSEPFRTKNEIAQEEITPATPDSRREDMDLLMSIPDSIISSEEISEYLETGKIPNIVNSIKDFDISPSTLNDKIVQKEMMTISEMLENTSDYFDKSEIIDKEKDELSRLEGAIKAMDMKIKRQEARFMRLKEANKKISKLSMSLDRMARRY